VAVTLVGNAPNLALVTVGLGLNLRASILLGPQLHDRFGVSPASYLVLIALPLLVAAVVRLPVGVLTDRYGVRVMLAAVSLVAAVSVAGLALAGSLPAAVVAGAVAGTGGSAFVVGAALVSRMFPYGRRGWSLGVVGLGVAVAAVVSAVSWAFDREGRLSALVLGALLTIFAALAATLLQEPAAPAPVPEPSAPAPVPEPSAPAPVPEPSAAAPVAEPSAATRIRDPSAPAPVREAAAMVRLAATSSVTLLYVVALSGMVSIAVFLPVYLATDLHLPWVPSLAVTGTVVTLASVARLAGGRRTDRHPTARLLAACYGVAAGLCLVVAVAPRSWVPVVAIAGIAVCDGAAGGVLLALIGKAARPYHVGAVMGATGAAGSLGALIPPLLLAGVERLTHSYALAWSLLASILLAAALYARTFDLRVGLGLAVGFRPAPSPTATTVAVLGESHTRLGAAAVVAGLAELATSDELLVVYGVDDAVRRRLSADRLAEGLRTRLPRHSVIAVPVREDPDLLGRDALVLVEHVEAGTLTIAVTRPASQDRVAADLSIYLQADRVLAVSYDLAEGAALTRR
jgi:NNP family nitrate/nitrite transporter-like MFS transporter